MSKQPGKTIYRLMCENYYECGGHLDWARAIPRGWTEVHRYQSLRDSQRQHARPGEKNFSLTDWNTHTGLCPKCSWKIWRDDQLEKLNIGRVRLRRVKGWRMPPNTVSTARPSRWGNPFATAAEFESALGFARYAIKHNALFPLTGDAKAFNRMKWIAANLELLRGKSLACYCAGGAACHADVLLDCANDLEVVR